MAGYTEDEVAAQTVATFELKAEGRSHRYIAERLGISVSTVHERWSQAQTAAEFAAGMDTGAERRRDAAQLDLWLSRVADEYAQGDLVILDAVRAVVALYARRHKLLGLDMPARIAIADERKAPGPSPETIAAIRKATQRSAHERAEIERENTEGD